MTTTFFRQPGKAPINVAAIAVETEASTPSLIVEAAPLRTQATAALALTPGDEITVQAAALIMSDATDFAQPARFGGDINAASAAPSAPDMNPASDTGASDSDDITTDATPTLRGSGGAAGITIRIYEGAALIASTTANGAGNWVVTLPVQTEGLRTYHAVAFDGVDESGTSGTLNVTIDLRAPDASTIDLDTTSDTGADDADDLTNDTTPTLSGVTEAGALIRILRDNVEVDTITADGSGNWSWTSEALADGDYLFKARAEDLAGNVSGDTDLTVSIDTSPPPCPDDRPGRRLRQRLGRRRRSDQRRHPDLQGHGRRRRDDRHPARWRGGRYRHPRRLGRLDLDVCGPG